MKKVLAGLITAAVLGGVLFLARRESPRSGVPDAAAPEDCIHRMFAAAEQGDVDSYLECFTGVERERLERELADQPREVYARSLAEALQDLKGRAVFAPDSEESAEEQVSLTVERVYATRTDRQTYRLVWKAGRWRIAHVQAAQSYQPEKAYGTPVFEMPQDDSEAP